MVYRTLLVKEEKGVFVLESSPKNCYLLDNVTAKTELSLAKVNNFCTSLINKIKSGDTE